MTSEELIVYAIDKFSAPGASSGGLVTGLLLISSSALWVKKYIINGNLTRYFSLKEREILSGEKSSKHLEEVEKRLDVVIEEQRRLLGAAKQ